MALNEWTEEDKKNRPPLPPTDSRFRPDVRQMEQGNIDLAGQEKDRLEEKQRASRRALERRQEEWQPRYERICFSSDDNLLSNFSSARWFRLTKHEITGQEVWVSNEKYWHRNWKDCPDIY
jgi:hypothetical protein